MSTDEVLCQISTFLAAGHETTCSALTWCLYALAKDQRVQSILRDDLRRIQDQVEAGSGEQENHEEGPGYHQETLTNQILKCTYLDWVVRECLRLHAPVTSTMRVCMRDYDEIPLSNPIHCDGERIGVPPGERMGVNEANVYGDRSSASLGSLLSEKHPLGLGSGSTSRTAATTIPIRKWDIISVPIQAINKSEVFWGEDAGVFRCDFFFFFSRSAFALFFFSLQFFFRLASGDINS